MTTTRNRRIAGVAMAFGLVLAACSDGDDGEVADQVEPTDTGAGTDDPSASDGESVAIDEERCQANRDAGTIDYVTGFDFAAAAGIAEAIVADAQGYFEELCLDVVVQPGFAPSNAALVIEGEAEMGASGSFAELVDSNVKGEGDLVALLHLGRTAIEEIVVPAGEDVDGFDDLCGTTVGIKGDLPYSLQAAVALSGVERSCFDEVLLDGFDPIAHLDLGIDALPVYKSNEPYALDQAGVDYSVLDPLDFDVPSSFGIPFASQAFIDDHPQAVTDVVRALAKGYEHGAANPEETVDDAFALIDAAGNPVFLAEEVELYRWRTESGIVADLAPEGVGVGIPDLDLLGAEVEAMTEAGVFDELPDWRSMVGPSFAESVYDGTELQWPGT